MFRIENKIINNIKIIDGEKLTENAPIVYEFVLDMPCSWISKRINFRNSSQDFLSYIEAILGVEISHLDFKYAMELAGIKGKSFENGIVYYPINELGYSKIKKWGNERRNKGIKEEKYKRMREEILVQKTKL